MTSNPTMTDATGPLVHPQGPQHQLAERARCGRLLAEMTRNISHPTELDEILQVAVGELQRLLVCDRVIILQDDISAFALEHPPRLVAEATAAPAYSLTPPHCRQNPFTENSAYISHYRQPSLSLLNTAPETGVAPEILTLLTLASVQLELAVPIVIKAPSLAASSDSFSNLATDISSSSPPYKTWGLITVHQCVQSAPWTPLDIEFVQQVASQLAAAVQYASLLKHLDDRVAMSTADLRSRNRDLQQTIKAQQITETSLRRSEHQLREVTNALPALVAYIDTAHRYRFNNYAYEDWYSIPYQQIRGRQVCDIVPIALYRQMLPYLEQALAGEKVTYEAEMIQSNGRKVWTSISYIPDWYERKVKGLFSLVSDISDRKAIEHHKDEFVSVVSHELRTPLTSVHGSLRLLATGQLGELNAQGQELIEISLNNTERLTRLINDMLDLERISSDQVSMLPAFCSASELVQDAVKAMQSMANDYGITLSTEANPIQVWADSDHIMQALTNLISNAIKFSPKGSTVFVKARQSSNLAPTAHNNLSSEDKASEDKVEFLVKDVGRGIPSDKLETIFERFQQVDSSDARERGGTGLGLSICREIIQQHRGRIWVKSVHGQGSSFYFTLPLSVVPEACSTNATAPVEKPAMLSNDSAQRLL